MSKKRSIAKAAEDYNRFTKSKGNNTGAFYVSDILEVKEIATNPMGGGRAGNGNRDSSKSGLYGRVQDSPETLQSTLEGLYIDDTTLKEMVESTRLDMTLDRTIELVEDIARNTEDIDTVEDPLIRILFTAREAYTRGVLVGLDSYREAIRATTEDIKER